MIFIERVVGLAFVQDLGRSGHMHEGVPADIEVEQTPADVIAGKDPQLERAIQVALEELQKNPVRIPARPRDPVR